jgi:hypothetical protein
MGNLREPRLTVDTPVALDLDARTSDGALKVSGVQGTLELHTSDGAVDIEDVGGAVRLTASDGSIKIRNVTGTLESRSSDGQARGFEHGFVAPVNSLIDWGGLWHE